MESIGKVVNKRSYHINVNDNKDDTSNVSNGRYALNRDKFTPNNPETQAAKEIADKLNDLNNYAFYLKIVNELGYNEAYRLCCEVLDAVKERTRSKNPIRSAARYFTFMWKLKTKRVESKYGK